MCLAFLVRNPHQLGKLLFEIDNVLKDKRVPDIDDLDKLKYTEMVGSGEPLNIYFRTKYIDLRLDYRTR
jgi:hypothetical protein